MGDGPWESGGWGLFHYLYPPLCSHPTGSGAPVCGVHRGWKKLSDCFYGRRVAVSACVWHCPSKAPWVVVHMWVDQGVLWVSLEWKTHLAWFPLGPSAYPGGSCLAGSLCWFPSPCRIRKTVGSSLIAYQILSIGNTPLTVPAVWMYVSFQNSYAAN